MNFTPQNHQGEAFVSIDSCFISNNHRKMAKMCLECSGKLEVEYLGVVKVLELCSYWWSNNACRWQSSPNRRFNNLQTSQHASTYNNILYNAELKKKYRKISAISKNINLICQSSNYVQIYRGRNMNRYIICMNKKSCERERKLTPTYGMAVPLFEIGYSTTITCHNKI